MSEIYRCDFCGKEAPIKDHLELVKVGDNKIGDVCLDCNQRVKTVLTTLKQEMAKIREQPEQQPQPQEPKPEQPKEMTQEEINTMQGQDAVRGED